MGSELRLAIRRLAREPALAAVATLALGIGACTAMFSIIEAVLLKSMNRLSRLPGVQSAAAVLNRPFAHAVIGWDSALLLEGQADVDATWLKSLLVNFEAVTPGYFPSMGIQLRRGRDSSSTDR